MIEIDSKDLSPIIKISSQLTGIISSITHFPYFHIIFCFIFAFMLLSSETINNTILIACYNINITLVIVIKLNNIIYPFILEAVECEHLLFC